MHLAPLVLAWLLAVVLLALDGRRAWVCALAAAGLLTVLGVDLFLLTEIVTGTGQPFEVVTGGWTQGVGIRLRVDGLSLFFASICAAVLCAVMVHEGRARVRSRLFPSLLLFLCTGLHGAFFTGDLFNFYVFFELSIVSSFALAAYGYGRAEVRGAIIYITINLLGSVLFLSGVAVVYQATGVLDMAQIAAHQSDAGRGALTLGATLVFVSLALKLGMFPFHGWVPVLYSHARPAVAAAMTGALVNVGAYGLLRLGFSTLAPERADGAEVLVLLGASAGVYGALLALRRTRPAEVLAYSAVAHAGYVVFGVGVGGVHGAGAVLLVVLSGSLDKALMFLSLGSTRRAARHAALVGAASAAGLPITVGFFSKIELLRSAMQPWTHWLALLALVAVSVLILAAMMRFLRMLRCHDPPDEAGAAAAVALAGVVVVLGLVPAPVVAFVARLSHEVTGGLP